MFNSQVLDIVIGLVFIYLIYSLLATILMELLASIFSFRAKILERGVYRMLQDDCQFTSLYRSTLLLFLPFRGTDNKAKTWYRKLLVKIRRWLVYASKHDKPQEFIDSFYNHPTVQYMSEGAFRNKPAYLRKETFSKVITDLLKGTKLNAGGDIRGAIEDALENNKIKWEEEKRQSKELENSETTFLFLNSIWVDAQGDIDKFKTYLEQWFEETMERASGWYKKNTQLLLFLLGLLIAYTFNIDTIRIVKKLEKDPKLRTQLITQADNFLKAYPDLNQITDSAVIERRDSLFEWGNTLISRDVKNLNNVLSIKREKIEPDGSLTGWEKFIAKIGIWFGQFFSGLPGWALTALAISLGAPFWFDLLNKLMKLRTSIATKSQEKKAEERSAMEVQVPNLKRKG